MYSNAERDLKDRKFDFDNDVENSENDLTMPVRSEERARDFIGNDDMDAFSLDTDQTSSNDIDAKENVDESLDVNNFNLQESSLADFQDDELANEELKVSDEYASEPSMSETTEKKSLFSSGSAAKVPERKRTGHGIGKSGDHIHLSANADKDARGYIDDVDTFMPEKMRSFDGSEEENDDVQNDEARKSFRNKKPVKQIRKNQFSDSSAQPKDVGGFELDTGWVNFGVNNIDEQGSVQDAENAAKTPGEKRKEKDNQKDKSNVFVAFQSNYDDDDARQVKESREKKFHVGGGNYVKSNDESFQTGAEYMESGADKPKLLRTKWERLSNAKGNKGTYDDVVPFHQSKREEAKINQLRETARDARDGRTEVQKAITGMQTYKNKKDAMKRDFDKKFDRKVTLIKEQYRSPSNFWLLLKKKKDEEEENNVWFDGDSAGISDDEKIIDGIVKDTVSDAFEDTKK